MSGSGYVMGLGDRVLRVDGGAHADHRRQVVPAGVPQEWHLHDAGIPREALQPGGAQRDGHLLARAVRLREPDVDPVAGCARGATLTGLDIQMAITALGVFACAYALYGGLKAVALTDIVQVSLLVLGGMIISYIALDKIGGDAGVIAGFNTLTTAVPGKVRHDPAERQSRLQRPARPRGAVGRHVGDEHVVLGLQSVHHPARSRGEERARGAEGHRARSVPEAADAGDHRAARHCRAGAGARPREDPTKLTRASWRCCPWASSGLVFAALVAAIVASTGSKINSIATIFTMDLYRAVKPETASSRRWSWWAASPRWSSVIIAMLIAKPLLGSFGQGFQYIQEFTGFVTPGICVIFLLGLFWERTTATAAMVSMLATVVLSWLFYKYLPEYPFMNRVGWCFVAGIVIAVAISLMSPQKEAAMRVDIKNVDFKTGTGFNIAAFIIIASLAALYYMWW